MYSLNRAQLIGNLTRDPELRTTASGQSVVNFSIATNLSFTDKNGQRQDRAEFHNVVAWGKLAEICNQFLAKGRKAYIEGRLQTREWEGQDGGKRRTTEIVADQMIMLDKTTAGTSQSESAPMAASAPATTTQQTPQTDEPPMPDPIEEIQVEDIPF